MSRISAQTLGCKVNFADTREITGMLPERADVPLEIVATCCVTAEGEKQSRKEVRRAVRRVGDKGLVFVTGCAARLRPEAFERLGGNVRVFGGSPGAVARSIRRSAGLDGGSASAGGDRGAVRERTRSFLKVQDGCDRGCSYCVVPKARGAPVSSDSGELVRRAAAMVEGGCLELVVSGINVGAYDDGAANLASLMDRLASIEGLARLRLSSIEAEDLGPELLDVINRHGKIGRHLHLPLQSGDDGVLRSMNRRYDTGAFAAKVDQARASVPGLNITTDVIVGYPTEDERAFRATLGFVEEMAFSRVHVFSYSRRPMTRALKLGDRVSPEEKKERNRVLRELSARLQREHRQRKVGRASEILLESRCRDGRLGGYSLDYTRFMVAGGEEGELVKVMAESAGPGGVYGSVVNE